MGCRIFLGLRLLERAEDPVTDRFGVRETLQAWSVLRELLMTEVTVRRAGSENQVIVLNLGPIAIGAVDEDDLLVLVDADNLAHDDGGIALRAQDLANRCGDLCRRQRANGDLVEQRLEQVMVRAVDEHDLNGGVLQRFGGGQAGESSADDDNDGSSFTHAPLESKPAASFARSGACDSRQSARRSARR